MKKWLKSVVFEELCAQNLEKKSNNKQCKNNTVFRCKRKTLITRRNSTKNCKVYIFLLHFFCLNAMLIDKKMHIKTFDKFVFKIIHSFRI